MEYDENRELTKYVWDNFALLLTEFERRVSKAIVGREKATISKSPEMAAAINRWWSGYDDPQIEVALAAGPDAYRQQVKERLLAERSEEIFINRCPRCSRVVRTPKARQCFWCGFDWHRAET